MPLVVKLVAFFFNLFGSIIKLHVAESTNGRGSTHYRYVKPVFLCKYTIMQLYISYFGFKWESILILLGLILLLLMFPFTNKPSTYGIIILQGITTVLSTLVMFTFVCFLFVVSKLGYSNAYSIGLLLALFGLSILLIIVELVTPSEHRILILKSLLKK